MSVWVENDDALGGVFLGREKEVEGERCAAGIKDDACEWTCYWEVNKRGMWGEKVRHAKGGERREAVRHDKREIQGAGVR